jgi:hypothetical protein
MKIANIVAVAALGLTICGAAMAQDTGGAPSTIVNGNDEKIVCIHADPPTGSRMGAKKICHTNAEWRTIHANGQQLMNTFQDRSAVGHGE